MKVELRHVRHVEVDEQVLQTGMQSEQLEESTK
jgi:hypothetical protein